MAPVCWLAGESGSPARVPRNSGTSSLEALANGSFAHYGGGSITAGRRPRFA